MSETIYGWNEEKIAQDNGWTFLAAIDEGAAYEVDQTAIFADGDEWILATASGCSCWAGEWDVERYDSLEALFTAIGPKSESARQYNPSFAGAEALRVLVEERLNA